MARSLIAELKRHGLSILEDIDWEDLDAVLRGDPELVGHLKTAVWEAAVQEYFLRRIRADTVALIDEIERGP